MPSIRIVLHLLARRNVDFRVDLRPGSLEHVSNLSVGRDAAGRWLNLHRREFLGWGALGGLSLLGNVTLGATGRQINCLAIFLSGGASHIDLWDPKPQAAVEVRGEFSPIPTAVPGIWISELLPRTALVADRLAIVRSVTHDAGEHGPARSLMCRTGSDSVQAGLPNGDYHAGLASADFGDRTCRVTASGVRHVAAIVHGDADESPGEYGASPFGRSCLAARRLIEAGSRFVAVELGHWDTHGQNAFCLRELLAPQFDRAFAALIDDLSQRGLLASTRVVVTTEFGRTPQINGLAGRDHWPHAFSAVLAGAGIAAGTVIGATDRQGAEVVERPVTPAEIAAACQL